MRYLITLIGLLLFINGKAQLYVGADTISVLHNNYCLKMPLAGGINAAVFGNIDLNYDGKKDIIIYDKLNNSALGTFKCFENIGNPGETKYKHRPDLRSKFPQVYNWALFYDYNGDGKEDLFCSVTGGIQVYKNTGSASTGLQFVMTYSLLYSDYNPGGPSAVSNIYAGPVGLPAITDIDNDGDLDILTFSPTGIFVEYHKNKSKELYNHADSLVFELADQCWGKISENGCLVSLNQCPSRPIYESLNERMNGINHAGACLTAFDSDGDGDKDLIIGDISCNTVEYCHNTGTIANALVTDTTKLFPNFPAKGNTTVIKYNSFPSAHLLDVDNDGKQDLVSTPNTFGSENATSVWLYKNTSTTNTVNFQFVKNNFLQDEMIEAGQMSRPILLDYNADGKKDLLIGGNGIYINNARRPRFFLYENIGTLAQPAFSLVSTNYANLSTALNASVISAVPAPGDIDNDGDTDLLMITNGNTLSWYENTAGAGNPCNFSVLKFNHFAINFPTGDVVPQLFDFNNDGKLDLMVSGKNGRVYYYENNGTVSVPAFTLVPGSFPNVSLRGDFFVYGLDGFGAPYFYREGSQIKLLGGCITGQLYLFDVPSVSTASCTLIDSTANNILESTYSSPWFDDINGDGKPDLFVGNAGGGLSFYSSKAPEVSVKEIITNHSSMLHLYPNPAKESVVIRYEGPGALSDISIYTAMGQKVKSLEFKNNTEVIKTDSLPPGVYLIRFKVTDGSQHYGLVKRLIIE